MIVMFEHSEKRLGDRLKFEAQIHGAKIEERAFAPVSGEKPAKPKGSFVFGDPEAYKDMSKERREELTKQMMNRHKIWAQENKPMGGKTARMG